MDKPYYLAIDIGASSGRHIVGWREDGEIHTQEVYRFSNAVMERNGHLVWDMERLEREVRIGIDAALALFADIESLSIDTWGVDYVLLRENEPVFPTYAYRDRRTEEVIGKVHSLVPFEELYCHTGIQFQPFNTIYQLSADKFAGRMDKVTDFLMVPEYLMWRLCKTKAHEYTNATTTGLVNVKTGEFDGELMERLGLPAYLFPKLQRPGMVIGEYKGIKVTLCATHDTASAVEGIPMEGSQPYLSSGTWSLLGVKTKEPLTDEKSRAANYSNEGGAGYNRYQKNIMGMWLVQELRKELCPGRDYDAIVQEAEQSRYEGVVDANSPEFLSPVSMKAAFDAALPGKPQKAADYFRCAYRSLAVSYQSALAELEQNTGCTCEMLYIVGGGAKNRFLNRLTEETTGKVVVALPMEATALGNLKIQMEANL